jgi:hypothetical protein
MVIAKLLNQIICGDCVEVFGKLQKLTGLGQS